jgi:hypothetical protein
MKRIILLFALGATTLLARAQEFKVDVSGSVVEAKTGHSVEQATVQLLSLPDSAYVGGNVTDANGQFRLSLPKVKPGRYLLKLSFVGYSTQWKNIQLSASQPSVQVGRLTLKDDAILMKETVVTAEVPPVSMVEDTMVYNSSAYRVQEGAMLEELVKRLPGAEVDDDGNIKVNGKSVKKILMKGKEFFGDNTEISMKNVPADMVDKIKAYERKSDLARVTGIDDGEEEMVLDLTVKKGMDKGWFGNLDAGVGTKSRYSEKLMLNRFEDGVQTSLIGSIGNTGDPGFSRRGGGPRGGAGGLRTDKTGGVNFAVDKNKVEVGGNVNYSNNKNDSKTKTASETFLESGNSYSNSLSSSLSRSSNVRGDFRLEWKPDSMTNILFRPSFTYSTSDGDSNSQSATFNDDPYKDGITDPLAELKDTRLADILVNSQTRLSQSDAHSSSLNGTLQVNRKLGSNGRNVTFRGSAGYSNNKSKSASQSDIEYAQLSGDDQHIVRYTYTPTKNWNYTGQLTYSEPIFNKKTFLQFSYKYQYKYSKSDRSTYDLSDMDIPTLSLGNLPTGYNNAERLDADQSQFAEYKNYIHEMALMVRINQSKYRLNFGATVMPQKSEMSYKKGVVDTLVTRNVTNITPTLDFRYRFSKQTNLRINYRGSTSQPSMTDLLDVTDNSDPLNISKGNPGLKPSFTNTLRANFNTYNVESQTGIIANMDFSHTLNSISNKVTYNSETGGRVTQPENINGNWNASAMFGYNSTLKKNKKYTYSAFTTGSYNNYVSYFSQNSNVDASKSTTRSMKLGERLNGGYRSDYFDFGLNGSLDYTHMRNSMQSSNNQDVYNFSYGFDTNVRFTWNMSFSTSLSNSCRRGYSDASMNKDELLWNAQISQSFLKGNAATVSLQVFDILHQQSNISRTISATMRSDVEYNSINSYCMLHFTYKLNVFGDKKARERMRNARREGFDGPPPGADGAGGPPPGGEGGPGRGGFGGGRGGFGGGFGGGRP